MTRDRRPPPRRRPAAATPPPPGQPGTTTRIVLYAIGGLGFLGVLVSFWLTTRVSHVDPKSAAAARSALEAAGCTLSVTTAPPHAADHSDVPSPGTVSPAWTTDPPTSGPHYREPAVYGAYTTPLQQARVVHNLEHGAVAIQYGPAVTSTTVAALTRFYGEHLNGTLLAPYPPLGRRIALGAWIAEGGKTGQGVLATCTRFDRAAFTAFLTAYQFKGPERFPASALKPGSR